MRQRPVTAPQKTTSMARENRHEGRPSSSMGASNVIEEPGGLESTSTEEKEDSTTSSVKEEEEEGLILPNMEEIKEFSEEIEQILPSDFDFGK